MKQTDENKYSMVQLILLYMQEQQQATIDAAPGLAQNIQELQAASDEIAEYNNLQSSDRQGYRVVKDEFRLETVENALAVANATKAHANNTNNQVLFNQMKTTWTFLIRQRDTELRDRAQFIYDTANPLVANLETYGINQVYLDKFLAAINNFIQNMGKPRLSITDRKILNNKIQEEFDKIALILEDIDINVEALAPLYKDFVDQYFECRQIINYKTSVKAISGTIKDQTGQPIFKAKFTIKEINKTTKSTHKGNFGFKNIPDGTYQLLVTRPGFKTITLNIATVKGQTTKLNLVMEPQTTTNPDQ